MQNLVIDILWIWSIKKVYITRCLLVQIRYLEKASSWDMGQNALGQLDCRIFKSTIFPGQNYEKAKFCACWHRFMIIKIWLKNIGVSMVKNGWGHSSLRTLKLVVSQEGTNEINWFLLCQYKLKKAKSYFNNFWMIMVKNWCCLLGFRTVKSAVSQEWIEGLRWFFACWYKFRKAKSYFNHYWVGMVKNGRGLIDHGTLKSGASHKSFDEFSRLTDWFLYADSDGIIFSLTDSLNLWHLNARGPLQLC